MRKKTAIILAVIVLAAMVIIFPPKFGTITTAGLQTKSQNNLRQIALGYRAYAKDHKGNLPLSFDDLHPDYVDQKSIFYCRGLEGSGGYFPEDPEAAMIQYTSVYRGTSVADDLHILYEQPVIWKDGTVCYPILEKREGSWMYTVVDRIPGAKFERLLKQKQKAGKAEELR